MQNVCFIKKVYICAQSTVTDSSPQAGSWCDPVRLAEELVGSLVGFVHTAFGHLRLQEGKHTSHKSTHVTRTTDPLPAGWGGAEGSGGQGHGRPLAAHGARV